MKRTALIFATALFGLVCGAYAQPNVVPVGTKITVRTNEAINTRATDGRIYTGVVNNDVVSESGAIAIPRGANAELIVRRVASNEVAVDLESVTLNGQRYALAASEVTRGRKQGLGENKRTGEYVGGGALLGTILGAVAGGGRGAAIGALAGGAAGAGTQVLTRGSSVRIPPEAELSFRLEQPLSLSNLPDGGYTRHGHHYHRDNY